MDASSRKVIEGYFAGLAMEPPQEEDMKQIYIDGALLSFTTFDDIGYDDAATQYTEDELIQPNTGIWALQHAFGANVRSSHDLQAHILAGKHIYYDIWMQSPQYAAFTAERLN